MSHNALRSHVSLQNFTNAAFAVVVDVMAIVEVIVVVISSWPRFSTIIAPWLSPTFQQLPTS